MSYVERLTIICADCNLEKPVDDFYKNSGVRRGYRNICKICFGVRYPMKYTEKSRLNWQNYKKSPRGIVSCLLNNASDRAKKRNIEYSLDAEWLREKIDKGVCELSGIEFQIKPTDTFRANPFSPSIDKINPKGGYTKENCRVICFCVNMAMSDWGEETLFYMCEMIIKNQALTWKD